MTKQNNDKPTNSGELKNTQPTKTGEQMLIELGYALSKTENAYVFYRKDESSCGGTEKISFYMNAKLYEKNYEFEYNGENESQESPVNPTEHKAIHQCLLDFGWIKE